MQRAGGQMSTEPFARIKRRREGQTISKSDDERQEEGEDITAVEEWSGIVSCVCVLRLTERQPDRETDDTQQTAGWKQCTFMLTLTLGLYLHGGTLNILQAA